MLAKPVFYSSTSPVICFPITVAGTFAFNTWPSNNTGSYKYDSNYNTSAVLICLLLFKTLIHTMHPFSLCYKEA
jgi:hypothetical protein